ncbi:hypothetical protein [Aurantiacibacter sp. D1-12]|uniref:hypothetical protein n=1 Tax=Aurantiacibacter sp. D1-12 TaxID=2993658 RepID=UPI00237CD15C|nr:hypothetical protein [Aurantiacibacter sp. D1-12]MDE1466906.1 hypothetical protein [Aurantiacibacter sp. D1-12]
MIGRDELKGLDKVHLKKNRGTAFIKRMIVGAATVAIATLVPQASLMAQESAGHTGGNVVEPVCSLVMRDLDGRSVSSEETLPGGGIVTANCQGQGFVLGEADGFVTMPHRATGAVIAVVDRESESRVWLFSRSDDGSIVLEELSYELARAAGRAPTSGLVDVRINLARFRATGVVSAVPSGREGARPARAADITLEGRLGVAQGRGEDREGGQ